MEAFVDESPRLMTAIREAIAGGDPAALRVAAHTLKGSMRYFGASRVFDDAYQLEKMGQNGNLENAEAALTDLDEEMARLTPVLLDYLRGNDVTDDS